MTAFTLAKARKDGTDLIDHFCSYGSRIMLDTGEFWTPEPFQIEAVTPILYGVKESWVIIGEGNAKTTLMAAVALYGCDYSIQPWIPVGASSRDQANILAQQAYQMIRQSPGMLDRFRIYEGYRRIMPIRPDHPGRGSRGIMVYAADVATGDGVIPYPFAICDEGHRHPDMRLYRLWKGKLNKRQGQIVMISTAGEPGTEFEEMRDAIRDQAPDKTIDGAHVQSTGKRLVMNEWMVLDPEDIKDMEKVKEANPLSTIQLEDLQDDFDSPTTDIGDWKRLKCNIPSRSTNSAVSDAEWSKAGINVDIPVGERIDLGCDVAWKHDTFAIVPMWRASPDYFERIDADEELEMTSDDELILAAIDKLGSHFNLLGNASILIPPRDGSTLHPDKVKEAFLEIFERNPVDAIVMDMQRAEDIASWLEDECAVTVIDREQGNAAACEDYESFMEGLRSGRMKHTNHSGLRAHVMHAIARSMPGDKKRFDRPSQSRAKRKQDLRVVDALTAAAMVHHYGDQFGPQELLLAWR